MNAHYISATAMILLTRVIVVVINKGPPSVTCVHSVLVTVKPRDRTTSGLLVHLEKYGDLPVASVNSELFEDLCVGKRGG